MIVKVDLPEEAIQRLAALCVREKRPFDFQLEVQLLRSLGLWSETPPTFDESPTPGARLNADQ